MITVLDFREFTEELNYVVGYCNTLTTLLIIQLHTYTSSETFSIWKSKYLY